jgi:hypothetical protein
MIEQQHVLHGMMKGRVVEHTYLFSVSNDEGWGSGTSLLIFRIEGWMAGWWSILIELCTEG